MYNILICDDDRDIVEALKIYLSGEDYRLFAAYTARRPWRWSASTRSTASSWT